MFRAIQSWNKSHSRPLSSVRVAPERRACAHRREEARISRAEKKPWPRLLFRIPRSMCIPCRVPLLPLAPPPSFLKRRSVRAPRTGALTVPEVHSCTNVFQYKQLANEFSLGPRASDFWPTWRRCFCLRSRPRGLSAAKALRRWSVSLSLSCSSSSSLSYRRFLLFASPSFSLLILLSFVRNFVLKISLHFFFKCNLPQMPV